MKVIETVCDRCGLVVETFDRAEELKKTTTDRISRTAITVGSDTLYCDLCTDCESEVKLRVGLAFVEIRQFVRLDPASKRKDTSPGDASGTETSDCTETPDPGDEQPA